MRFPTPDDDPGQWPWVMLKLDRPALTTKFVMALHDASIRNPTSWRRVSAIGARTGIKGADLERVVADVVAAGLVQQRADDPSLEPDEQWLAACQTLNSAAWRAFSASTPKSEPKPKPYKCRGAKPNCDQAAQIERAAFTR